MTRHYVGPVDQATGKPRTMCGESLTDSHKLIFSTKDRGACYYCLVGMQAVLSARQVSQ